MKASDFVKQFQQAVNDVEAQGFKLIEIVNLKTYLKNMLEMAEGQEQAQPQLTEAQAEHQLEVWKAQLSAHSTFNVEMFKAVIEAGQTALKSAILINGGAAVALLAFAGNAITKWKMEPGTPLLTSVGWAMTCFAGGTGVGGVATAFRYLSQYGFGNVIQDTSKKRWLRFAYIFQCLSIAAGVASFALFFVGGWGAYRAIALPH
ncbi:hypothetical protein [Paraburkholderia sp. 2C]